MICSGCGLEIAPGSKYIVATVFPSGDLFIKVGCIHRPVGEAISGVSSIFGSGQCFDDFMQDWQLSHSSCSHPSS